MSQMPGNKNWLLFFDIGEDDPRWPRLRALLHRWGRSEGSVTTSFSKQEIDSARWLEIAAWHHGYPQPKEGTFGFREATYDLSDWCRSCDIGRKQKAPFQMKREPRWGRNSLMQFVWIYDEIFATPDAWSRVFKPSGVGCRAVLNTKGVELKTVVQLVVEEPVGLRADGYASARCDQCGRTKYLPVARGFFPALRDEPSGSMARTVEYFGDGAQANHGLLVSQSIVRAMVDADIRGAWFVPVAEVT